MKKLTALAISAFAAAILAFGFASDPVSAITPTPVAVATPDLGCPCVYLHAERTDIKLGETATFSLEMLNGINKPEMTVQLTLRVPSGWSVTGRGFDNECSGQCSAVYSVPTGKQENIKIAVRPNESGDYRFEGTTQWFFTGDPSNARVETEAMSVTVADGPAPLTPIVDPPTVEPTGESTQVGECPDDRFIWVPPNQTDVCIAGGRYTWVLIGIIIAIITLLATIAAIFKKSS